MVKWNNPGKRVTPFPTPWCSSYLKGHQLTLRRQSNSSFGKVPAEVGNIMVVVAHYSTLCGIRKLLRICELTLSEFELGQNTVEATKIIGTKSGGAIDKNREFGCLVIRVLWHINLCRLSNAKSVFTQITVLFQIIQFRLSTEFKYQNSCISSNLV